ncbi:MAG: HAMP domain-containing sensor histidine kinase [Paracoccaceae bacterium]
MTKAALPRMVVSTPLRLTAALIAVFVTSLLISFAVSYLVIRDSFDDNLRDQVSQHIAEYQALSDPEALRARLVDDIAATQVEDEIIQYQPDQGLRLSNVDSLPVVEGTAILAQSDIVGTDINDSYLATAERVGPGVLTIGLTRAQLVDTGEIFVSVLMISLLPTLLIASVLGLAFARRARRRIDEISRVLQQISHGDLTARVPLDPADHDDLAVIGAAVNRMAEAQGAAMDSLHQVSADIAHDLKTPIQRVAVTLDTLAARTKLSAEQDALVGQALDEMDRIARTFEALLRIAQIEGGALRDRFVPVDLGAVAASVVDVFAPSAEETGHTLRFDPPSGAPVTVSGDRDLLGQVVANLIENSLRHCPEAGQISLSLAVVNGHPRFEIADSGPGIPEAERPKVLRRLYRLERSRTTPGNGLGLSMVAAICEMHGARLSLLDNAPGLRVRIDFPAA